MNDKRSVEGSASVVPIKPHASRNCSPPTRALTVDVVRIG